jgi:hypothetical protein
MDELKAFRVPALILSGGEPLLRPDIFEISARSKQMGFFTALSSNGTLIDAPMCERITDIGYDYVGVSLDGLGATHDKFRRMKGAFDLSLAGIRLCREAGLKVGVRYTMTQDNHQDLPGLLEAGRGRGHRPLLFFAPQLRRARQQEPQGRRPAPDDAQRDGPAVRHLLELPGSAAWSRNSPPATTMPTASTCFTGCKGASRKRSGTSEEAGAVGRQFQRRQCRQHRQPGQRASRHHVVAPHAGQCARAFLRRDLERYLRPADGRAQGASAHGRRALRRLRHFAICGGNTRVRAQQLTGDAWSEDPGCYLGDEEIGSLDLVKRIEKSSPAATLCRRVARCGVL